MRLALCKYQDLAPNPRLVGKVEAVESLIINNLREHFVPAPWQVFRDEELWTREVNLVFFDNEDGLRKLYAKYAKPSINKIPFAAAVRLLTTDCSLRLDHTDAVYCYGMSLTTCVDLIKATPNKVMHQSYEEFLEMLARAAELHFQFSAQEGAALWEKILLILDELFLLVDDCVPVAPKWTEAVEDAQSEPEEVEAPLQRANAIAADLFIDDISDP